jgi:uncharacterized RDD family membrane protein YckC
MFIIIGGDGKEYGPVTTDQVRTWINAGRANLDTKAKALGSEEWRRLGDFAEFSPPSGAPPLIRGESASVAITTPALTGVLLPAERGTRLLARVIDWALEFIAAIPGGLILGSEFLKLAMMAMQGEDPDFSQLDYQRLWLGGLVFGAAWLVLFVIQVWMLTTRGQSIGKRLTGIRIVRVEDESNPGIVHAWVLRQCLFTIVGIITSLIPILGILFRPTFHLVDWCMIFRDDQRCLHDLVAKTKVVRV